MTKRAKLAAVAVVLLGTAAGGAWWVQSHGGNAAAPAHASHGEVINGVVQDGTGRQVLYWHDPMVPGHKFDKPGKSPFMDMQLVPQYADDDAGAGVRISARVLQNLGVRLGQAEVTALDAPLLAVGRVAFDEHQVEAVQTRAAGFVEHLYVRSEGDAVQKGQKVAEVYAPELLAAQQELVALAGIQGVPDLDGLRAAARERLRLLGMSEGEIRAVEKSRTARRTIGVYAPTSGVVRELGVREGAQVMPGQTLVQLAGLSNVWMIGELTERESGRVHEGQMAHIRVEALPGESFEGKVNYIYPQLDATARTAKVRIEVQNQSGRLRPGMYGQVQLTTAERKALTVPSEAVIATGSRNVVIVRQRDGFMPVEVRTGAHINERTEILAGVEPGAEVVLSGQFLIDSEASLKGVLARLEPVSAAGVPSETVLVKAVVVDLKQDEGMVMLTHEPVPALQWPAMTMNFKVRDRDALATMQRGDAVRFAMRKTPEDGDYVIESIEISEGAAQ